MLVPTGWVGVVFATQLSQMTFHIIVDSGSTWLKSYVCWEPLYEQRAAWHCPAYRARADEGLGSSYSRYFRRGSCFRQKKPELESPGCPVGVCPDKTQNADVVTGLCLVLTRSVSVARSDPEPVPECSTSASRSAATDTASLRPRTDLPLTRVLPPAGFVLRQKASPER